MTNPHQNPHETMAKLRQQIDVQEKSTAFLYEVLYAMEALDLQRIGAEEALKRKTTEAEAKKER